VDWPFELRVKYENGKLKTESNVDGFPPFVHCGGQRIGHPAGLKEISYRSSSLPPIQLFDGLSNFFSRRVNTVPVHRAELVELL
jgi:hypothetical protein